MLKIVASFVGGIVFTGVLGWNMMGGMMFNERVSPFGLEETVARIQQNIQAAGKGWSLAGLRFPAKAVQADGGNALPVIMVFLSIMMISEVKYPSFKSINLRVRSPFAKLAGAVIFIGFLLVLRERILPLILPVIFTAYLLYGFVRPRLSRKVREEIEEEEPEDDPKSESEGNADAPSSPLP